MCVGRDISFALVHSRLPGAPSISQEASMGRRQKQIHHSRNSRPIGGILGYHGAESSYGIDGSFRSALVSSLACRCEHHRDFSSALTTLQDAHIPCPSLYSPQQKAHLASSSGRLSAPTLRLKGGNSAPKKVHPPVLLPPSFHCMFLAPSPLPHPVPATLSRVPPLKKCYLQPVDKSRPPRF